MCGNDDEGTTSGGVVGGSCQDLSTADRAASGMASAAGCADTCRVSEAADLRQPDEGLLELGRLALVGRLARGIVHELNNPLFVVLALVELMARAVEPGSQESDRLAQVRESSSELRQLVGAIGDLARAPLATEQEPVAVAEVLAEAVALIRRVTLRKDIAVVESYDDGDACVAASRCEVRLAALCVLVEAQEQTLDAGRIEVRTQRVGADVRVCVRWQARPGVARVVALDGVLAGIVAGCAGTLEPGDPPAGCCEQVLAFPLAG